MRTQEKYNTLNNESSNYSKNKHMMTSRLISVSCNN